MSIDKKISLKQELIRKFFHLPVLILPILPFIFEIDLIKILLSIVFILIIFFEIYRKKSENLWVNNYLRSVEKSGIAVYNFTFLTWVILIYPVDISYPYYVFTLATVPTSLGDATAAIIGRKFGKRKLIFTKQKTIEGAIAGFIIAIFLGFLMLIFANVSILDYFILPLIPAIVLTLLDLLEDLPTYLSDNMISGIISAFLIYIVL